MCNTVIFKIIYLLVTVNNVAKENRTIVEQGEPWRQEILNFLLGDSVT